MSFQAYIDNVRAKTGKTPEDFARLAAADGLTKHGEIVGWLKRDFSLGHGHATAIAGVILRSDAPRATTDEKLDALFAGRKAAWREPCDALMARIAGFGPDASVAAGGTYINLLRAGKKFGILQPSSAERLDIGVKLKGREPAGRLEAAGAWNTMVTHRVRIADASDVDPELLGWLKEAYAAA